MKRNAPFAAWFSIVFGVFILFAAEAEQLGELPVLILGGTFVVVGVVCATWGGS